MEVRGFGSDPAGPRTPVSAVQPFPYALPTDAPRNLRPGDLVEVTFDVGLITAITTR